MSQSLSKIYIHLIFHIKTTSPVIRETELERVHSYIGQLVNTTGSSVMRVGGTEDHVHILFLLSNTKSISQVAEEVKRNSSRWIKTVAPYYRMFEWQSGYGAFSISGSVVDKALRYIEGQHEHHKKRTFREEYTDFLKMYGIEYNEKYLWSD